MKLTIDNYIASSHCGLETSTLTSHHSMDNVLKTNLEQIGMDSAKQTNFSGAFFNKSCSSSYLDGLLGNPSKKVERTTKENLSSEEETPKPKRPLTAYNLFFRSERLRIIGSDASGAAADDAGARLPREKRPHRKTHGKISFMDLAKQVGKLWRSIDTETRAKFKAHAAEDMKRYREEMEKYRQNLHLSGGKEEKKDVNDTAPKRKTKNKSANLSSKVVAAGPKGVKVRSSSENINSSGEHYAIKRMNHIDALTMAIEICSPNSPMSGTFCDESNNPAPVQCQQHQTQKHYFRSPPLISQLSVSTVTSSQDDVDELCREAPDAQRSPSPVLDDADLLLKDLLLDEQLQLTTDKNNSLEGTEWRNHHSNFINSKSFHVIDYAATTEREEEEKTVWLLGGTRKRRASEECVTRRVSLKSSLPDDDYNESVNSLISDAGNSEGSDIDSIFDISHEFNSDNTSSDLSIDSGGDTVRMLEESPKASNNVGLLSLTKSMTQSDMSRQLLHDLSSSYVGTQLSQHRTIMRRSSKSRKHLLHALNGL